MREKETMLNGEVLIIRKRVSKKMYFNKYLTQFRHDDSDLGKMVRYMIKDGNFPMKERPYYCGFDYFIENGLNEFAETYRIEFQKFRRLNHTNTNEIKVKCTHVRIIGRKK